MAITDTIQKLFEYRENISDMIRLKDIDIPENTKLRNIPQYLNELEKKEHVEAQDTWTQEFQDQCTSESLANLLHERSLWSGHVDSDGLREIGWTEDDISYFQANGVDWNEEDDDKYLVSDYEKELYQTNAIRLTDKKVNGVTLKATYTNTLLTSNSSTNAEIVEWRNNIRWMPKFTDEVFPSVISFRNFSKMVGCPSFDFSKTINPSYLFSRCIELRCIPPMQFATATTSLWNGNNLCYECSKIKTIPENINWEKCYSLSAAFGDCGEILYMPKLNIPNVTTTANAFTNCKKIIGFEEITTSNKLTSTNDMFAGCRSLLTTPLFNTSNCTNMQNIFGNCQSLLNIGYFDTSKNTNFESFVRNCRQLKLFPDLNFDGGVTKYSNMFYNCESLQKLPSTMNFSECTTIAGMCYGCLSITEFPYKLNINATATSAIDGIKTYSNCFFLCTNLKKMDIGLCRLSSDNTFINQCVFIKEINVDDFDGTNGIVLTESNLFNVEKIGGELKNLRKSFNVSSMRKLPRESMLKLINAIEDMTGTGTTPTLTFGAEALRNLSPEDKLIATNKGWKLA